MDWLAHGSRGPLRGLGWGGWSMLTARHAVPFESTHRFLGIWAMIHMQWLSVLLTGAWLPAAELFTVPGKPLLRQL
jgi:hypothetical protein